MEGEIHRFVGKRYIFTHTHIYTVYIYTIKDAGDIYVSSVTADIADKEIRIC